MSCEFVISVTTSTTSYQLDLPHQYLCANIAHSTCHDFHPISTILCHCHNASTVITTHHCHNPHPLSSPPTSAIITTHLSYYHHPFLQSSQPTSTLVTPLAPCH